MRMIDVIDEFEVKMKRDFFFLSFFGGGGRRSGNKVVIVLSRSY